MKIIRLQTQGFQRVTALDVSPDAPVVEVRGNNGEGKTSLLASIQAALGGADAAPIKPIRTGDDFAAIRVTIGDGKPDLIVTKYFDEVGEKLRVENVEGDEIKAGQTKVADLLGRMTFDPLAFARMAPKDQAVELRRLVPLKVDLDQLAAADKADTLARRDVNRDAKALKVRIDAIPVETGLPDERPDLDALTTALAGAADTNTRIERERAARAESERNNGIDEGAARDKRAEAVELRRRADALDEDAKRIDETVAIDRERLAGLPALDEPVDTTAASAALTEARALSARFDRKEYRESLSRDFDALKVKSEGFTTAIEGRAKERADALAEAEMPVPGLSLATVDEDLLVTFDGEPFAQASGAQQLRVSMALAMAANPRLRVMLIRDGSLLDTNGLALVKELAGERDYQVWLESVGEGDGTGLIMEAGAVRGAPEPERLDPPKRRKAKGDAADHEVAIVGDKLVVDGDVVPEVRSITSTSGAAPAPAEPPARRKPAAMREFTSAKPGDLFGGGE